MFELIVVIGLFLILCGVLFLIWTISQITNGLASFNAEKLTEISKSGARIEAAAAAVAQDLSNAHARADAVSRGNHGEASDAANQQTEKERIANHNPTLNKDGRRK
jgi:hypothetical protein